MPFFSLFDDRARPKGSRDPLGFEVVWSFFGRRLVGNLTTITTSLVNFKVALMGFQLAHELTREVAPREHAKAVWEVFTRYEQLAALLRLSTGMTGDGLMGITRATQKFSELSQGTPARLSPNSDSQILSNQASYGLWGLYSSAMKQAGLLQGDEREPTTCGSEIAKSLLNHFSEQESAQLRQLIARDSIVQSAEELEPLASRFQRSLQSGDTDHELVEALLTFSSEDKAVTSMYQSLFQLSTRWIQSANSASNWTSWREAFLRELIQSPDATIRERAQDIDSIERLLVVCNILFDFLRGQHKAAFNDVIVPINDWLNDHPPELPDHLPGIEFPNRQPLSELLNHLHARNTERLIEQLLSHHASVMAARDGAPWVELNGQRQFNVRVGRENATLPSVSESEAPTRTWHYNYFLDAYLAVLHQSQPAATSGG